MTLAIVSLVFLWMITGPVGVYYADRVDVIQGKKPDDNLLPIYLFGMLIGPLILHVCWTFIRGEF